MKSSIYSTEYAALRDWFREKRKEQGLSQRDLAELAERHHSVIGKIETERKLDVVEFVQYCQLLNLDPYKGLEVIVDSLNKKTPAN